ncbi:MAG TPA: DUF2905 domain-containing protein [Burkholderiales bacterium]|nr:DUF2905 domain-containing protein [Burkholderiales bacterium]
MLKWLITVFVVLVILAAATPLLARFGLGRIPGDFRIPVRGRMYYVPLASTVILTLGVWLVGKLL